jgi:hypothetical protein
MDITEAKKHLIRIITSSLNIKVNITEDTQLIGGESLLDSMKLVEVCLALEDLAEEHYFEFDWTSDNAMSKNRSMFRTIASLAKEFALQSETTL